MVLYCTNRFKKSVITLAKTKRHYGCIHKRIKEDFLEIESCISIKGNILKDNSEKTLIKSRLKSCNNNGRSYGFRVYVLCDKLNKTAYCMEVYPKYGSKNTEALTGAMEAELLKEFKTEKENNHLIQVTWSKKDKFLLFGAPNTQDEVSI